MWDLCLFVTKVINTCFDVPCSTWLWNIARGISGEEVQGRLLPKSHGSGKTFPGPRALRSLSNVRLESQPDYLLIPYNCYLNKNLLILLGPALAESAF